MNARIPLTLRADLDLLLSATRVLINASSLSSEIALSREWDDTSMSLPSMYSVQKRVA